MPTRWLQHKLDMHPSILSENTKTWNGDRSVKTEERLEEFQRKGKRKKYIPKTYIHICPSEELLEKWQSEVSQGNYKGTESRWVWSMQSRGDLPIQALLYLEHSVFPTCFIRQSVTAAWRPWVIRIPHQLSGTKWTLSRYFLLLSLGKGRRT